ncbi:MAG: iron-containing alcohol dehydrogenase [Clostridia bacterium]|nr:iron-containing alcohol dehydrogenase [Clostridia bacterium]
MVNKPTEIFYRAYQTAYKGAMTFLNWDEPYLLKGEGAVKKLPALVKSKGINNVLIVTDKGLMSLGLLNGMLEQMDKNEVKYVIYDGVQPNPTIDNIEEARRMYLKNGCQGIIAFGGGSPMDCAKAAGARVTNPNKSVVSMRGQLKIVHKLPPFFAVPTTAGTGSEVTLAAVVSNPETHEKNAINDPKLRPKYAVLDPELTLGLPPHITSTTGMDALTHAVEAYIGRSNVASTEKYAEDATKLIFENLEKVYENDKDVEARENMLMASYWAGMAFTRAYVGYVHAIAHNLGGLYGTPHGLANAVILPYVLEYFGESAYPRLAKLADVAGITEAGMSVADKAKLFIKRIKEMNANMNIPEHFEFIEDKDIPTLVQRALKEANPLYPVPKIMDEKDCREVILKIRG